MRYEASKRHTRDLNAAAAYFEISELLKFIRGPFPFRYPEKGIWKPWGHQRLREKKVQMKEKERCVDKNTNGFCNC